MSRSRVPVSPVTSGTRLETRRKSVTRAWTRADRGWSGRAGASRRQPARVRSRLAPPIPASGRSTQPIPGSSCDVLTQAAIATGIYVAAGLTERNGPWIYNAAVLIAPDGTILLKHRKINLLDIEQPFYAIGDRLQVARHPFRRHWPEHLCRQLPGLAGPGPRAWPDGSPITALSLGLGRPLRPRPSAGTVRRSVGGRLRHPGGLYDMPVVGVSNVGPITAGPWQGRKCIGCSLAVDARGEVAAKAPYGESAAGLFPVEIDLLPPRAAGTDWAPALRAKGYWGP